MTPRLRVPEHAKPLEDPIASRELKQRRTISLVIFAVAFLEFLNFLIGPFGMTKLKTAGDYILLVLLIFYAIWGFRVRSKDEGAYLKALFLTPEVLLLVTLVLFLLDYLFASTADLSYAQRFALTHGNLALAPNAAIQELNSVSRYVPLMLLDATVIVYSRTSLKRWIQSALGSTDPIRVWATFLTLLAALLYTLSFPSFVNLQGYGMLAYISLVPILLVLYRASYGRGIFYGVAFGVLQTMLTNFWLGTFSLISLQFVTVVYLIEYAIFMTIMLWVVRRMRGYGWIIFAVAWVGFDYVRSLGFLGFPWGMLGTTQYQFLPLIQIASVTGVWGVTFIVTLVNAVIAHFLEGRLSGSESKPPLVRELLPMMGTAVLFIALVVGGAVAIRILDARPVTSTVRVALIQQDTDPHKADYAKTFEVLKNLTNEAMKSHPYLVVWSETAFVPNIRRWSAMNPNEYPLAKLVDEFLAYQKSLHTWLVTGNDDYTLTTDQYGNVVRKDYNAAVLFSPQGERMQTYHKIHLVPFTEYFPWKKQLPGMYNLLKSFDVYLWEPGTRRVVFQTPKLKFSTPICFEDSFPNDVRLFVKKGDQAIINISNDYWSLSKVEGAQHYVNGMFDAVENRVPLLRATASGLTAYVTPVGRLVEAAPYYKPAYLIADVKLHQHHESIYTRFGNWFPLLMLLIFVGMGGSVLVAMRRDRIAVREASIRSSVASYRRPGSRRPKRRSKKRH